MNLHHKRPVSAVERLLEAQVLDRRLVSKVVMRLNGSRHQSWDSVLEELEEAALEEDKISLYSPCMDLDSSGMAIVTKLYSCLCNQSAISV